MKKVVIIAVLVLALMEGVSWWIYKSFYAQDVQTSAPSVDGSEQQKSAAENMSEMTMEKDTSLQTSSSDSSQPDLEGFPPPSIEVKNGRTERTIHMGVRQYVWEPSTITAEKGELVRIIVHNADVQHGLVIPDLDVNQDIPPDGAVVEFIASKVGTFEFFCSVWCGEGHIGMRGKITINESVASK